MARGLFAAWVIVALLGCARAGLAIDGLDGADSADGAAGRARDGATHGTQGGGSGVEGNPEDPSGDGDAGDRVPPVSCAGPKDDRWFVEGSRLHVDHAGRCDGLEPCFTTIAQAVAAATSGDTLVVLPGRYEGVQVRQEDALGALRIVSRDGPVVTEISGRCMEIRGQRHDPGEIWIEGFTFRSCGPSTSLVTDGWAVAVSGRDADARIEGNVFDEHGGRGGIGVLSSTVDSRFHVVIARNRITRQQGEDAGILIDLPADRDEDYCIRIENNLIVDNDVGVNFFYTTFKEPHQQFELVNNTLADNRFALLLNGPTGRHFLVNNIFFGNEVGLPSGAELEGLPAYHNLFESGQFSGLDGNFADDPLFDDDYRLRAGSPALGRGEATRAPWLDLVGNLRPDAPDLGAYERLDDDGPAPSPACGDGVLAFGPADLGDGPVTLFEGCDDGNTVDGDGCSAECLLEPAASAGLISLESSQLCAVRADGTLSCWGDAAMGMPVGTFEQVAVSAYHACALRPDGTVACWGRGFDTFAPDDRFVQISSDYDQACGVRTDGGITCWDDRDVTRSEAGAFVRVDTNRRVCGITADGDATCWDPGESDPVTLDGPLLQTFPDWGGGCQYHPDATLRCAPDATFFLRDVPAAALARVAVSESRGLGIRPDGRVIGWSTSASSPGPDDRYVEVVTGVASCGLTVDRRVHCWAFRAGVDFPQE